jgi:hypothetical protein
MKPAETTVFECGTFVNCRAGRNCLCVRAVRGEVGADGKYHLPVSKREWNDFVGSFS